LAKVRFLHTADWQLGMQRHFLTEEAAPRFAQARIDVLRTIGQLAADQECAFVVAAGDLFESNHVDRRTIARTLEALESIPVPVYLLPGNHDPLDAGSIFISKAFADHLPSHVHLLDAPRTAVPGVEVVGAPWPSKRPRRDLVAETLEGLEPGPLRICVGHGIVDRFAPDADAPETIRLDPVRRALDDGRIHFLALGDRHSVTEVAPRVWYSGAPEPTDYDETAAGQVLIVDLDEERCAVTAHPVGRWEFVERAFELDTPESIDALADWLEEHPRKESTVLKLRLRGSLRLRDLQRLEQALQRAHDLFAGIQERRAELICVPDSVDLTELGLTGYERATVEALAELGRESETARDALSLLYRLAGGGA
jgi:DNA repair exonuclease SbcCD nuclease subunit